MQNIKGPKQNVSHDKALEIVTVRVGTSFLGLLSVHLILNGKTPTPKEFVPVYLATFLLIYAFMKSKFEIKEMLAFAKSYPFSFLACCFMFAFGIFFFLIGQAIIFSRQDLLQSIAGFINLKDISFLSAICGWIFIHFATALIYRDLSKMYSTFTIEKYLFAPVDGWVMGLFVYYFSVKYF